ncbi:MAG: P22 phage major capsid protein family protein [Methylobacter sp.]|uniref:P22 phage major capsid protein family protein n=1 Tax=Methylobacter sp. TaxID=2051955 RepID=UPI0027312808|nr:P22 phage major capsid protein family protein [Methylobacter sp.]MDP1664130.1 P22 phage major capsid protein family protein [Methylobacter sp.]
MSNTLSNLIPTMYAALNVVSREMVGFIPAVARHSGAERAALNQDVLVPVVGAGVSGDNTPGVTPPDTGDQDVGNVSIKMTKSRHRAIRWNGEQTLGMQNAGTLGSTIQQQFEQAFRELANEIETDLAGAYKFASRAYGTAGTTPFGTAGDLTDFAGVQQILDENGAPVGDRHLVIGSAGMFNIRGKQSGLFKANEAGTDELLRKGTLTEVEGLGLHNSGQVLAHTKGTGASYQTNLLAGYAAGDTALAVDTGTGTVLSGDIATFTGDANKYVVGTALSAGSLALNKPGLRAALANDVAMAVGNNYRANLAFHRNAIVLATRAPALPDGGDSAVDTYMITDSVTGLVFEIALYKQYLQNVIHVRLAWGWQAIKSEHIAVLLG